jgi:hypothetical protein
MKNSVILRIILDILIAISLLNGWWFLALPLALVGAWFFPYFIELIIAGIGYDSLFGFVSGMGIWGYMGTIVSVVLFAGISGVKRWVR